MEEKKAAMPHKLSLHSRKEGALSGIMDVLSFDEKLIVLASDCGLITIKGDQLHINQLNLEKGEVELTGRVDSITYSDEGGYGKKKGESVLGRLFK